MRGPLVDVFLSISSSLTSPKNAKKVFFFHDLFRELDDVDKIKKMFQRNETMVIHPMKFRKNITTSPFAICVILLHN